ncbi:MAG: ABC transporter ATP-binding protein [Caldilineaceae bacterium]
MKSEFTAQLDWIPNQRSPLRWILFHLLRSKWIIVLALSAAIGNALLAIFVPRYTGQAFNAVVNQRDALNVLFWATLWIGITQTVRGAIQFLRNFGHELLGQRLERDGRRELYAMLLSKSMGFHDLHPTGEIMARATNDVRELALMIMPGVNLVFGSGNFLIMPVLLAPTIHPALIWTPLLFASSYFLSMWHYLGRLQPATTAVRESFGRMNASLTAAIEGIETVKAAAQENAEVERFVLNASNLRNAAVRLGRIEAQFLPLLLFGVAEAGGLWHAIWLYQQGSLNLGQVVEYVGLLQLFGFPVYTSLYAYSQLSSGVASARRILELTKAQTALDQNEAGYQGDMKGDLCFVDVDFGYKNGGEQASTPSESGVLDRPSIHQVSFCIEAGKTLALVGQTGSGKSTLVKLINRIYDVERGQVMVDGRDVRQWNLAALRRQISIIEQDIFLFSRTIAENIAFGKPDATQSEIEDAARSAQAHDFISSFPQGYQTVIGERGVMLSGGQRQRIALARAFLTNPAILILDDSTSAIDSATEDQIQRAIEAASRGRTTILITHRLSQIRWADKIVVLRKGQVAAQGSHEELLEQSQAYRDIFARI